MSYPQEVKDLAYKLDPNCWVSYSGLAVSVKRNMDARRTASLEKAAKLHKPDAKEEARQERERMIVGLVEAIEEHVKAVMAYEREDIFSNARDASRDALIAKLEEVLP